jgi:metal-sulfur cluster biosynthetic enzyme
MADMIVEQARDVVKAIVPEGVAVNVHLVWEPPWTPDKMAGIAREHFGWTS